MSLNRPLGGELRRDPQPVAVALAGLAALALAIGIGRFAFTPLLAMMLNDQALSIEAGGWIASANLFGYLVGGLTARFFKTAPAKAARLSVVLVSVGTVIMAWPDAPTLWVLGRFIAGLASAWMMISISMLCLPVLASAPRLSAWVYAGVGCGITLTGTVCLAMVLLNQGSTLTWLLLFGACVGLGYPVWRVFKHATATSHTSTVTGAVATSSANPASHRPSVSVGSHLRLWILTGCYGLYGFGYIVPATFLPAQARIWLGESWTYSLAWPIFGLAAAVSTWSVGFVLKRIGRLPIWIGAHVVMAFGLLAPAVVPSMTTIVLAALCVGGTFLVITLVAMQEAQHYGGAAAGKWMARLTTAFAAGQLAGPILVSLMDGALVGALWLASSVLLASAFILYRVHRTMRTCTV